MKRLSLKTRLVLLHTALMTLVVSLVLGSWADRAAILMSVINVILFFGGSGLKHLKTQMGYWKTRRNFRKYMK